VIADPAGRLVWASPALPGARHDMGAAREHGIVDALTAAEVDAVADTAYQGGGPTIRTPQRRRRLDPDTGRYRRLSRNQKEANAAHARQRGPGERVNAELKNWRILVAASGSATATTSSTPTSTTSATTSATPPTATPTTTGGVAVGAGVKPQCRSRPRRRPHRRRRPRSRRRRTTRTAPRSGPRGRRPPGEASLGTRRTSTATTTGSAASRSSPSRRAASVPSGAVRSTVRSSGQLGPPMVVW
jgi:hypothetical protein